MADAIPEYSVHLDAIRGVAATVVFLGHMQLFFIQPRRKPETTAMTATPAVPPPGAVAPVPAHRDYPHQAVMAFFVLSGFLVGGSVVRAIRQRRWSWRKYIIQRLVRLWMVLIPALLLCLLLDSIGTRHFAAMGSIYATPANQTMIPPDLPSRLGPKTFIGNMFFLQDIKVNVFGTNQPLWSLSYEFWYYAAFPFVALLLMRRFAIGWSVLAVIVLAGISWFVGGEIAMYFAIWLMGAAAAVLPGTIPARYRHLCAWAAFLLFLVVGSQARYNGSNLFRIDLGIGLSIFVLLYCLAHLKGPSKPGFYRAGAKFLSRISYSLYLTNVPVICLMSAMLVGRWRTLPLNGPTLLILAEAATAVLLIACAVHFLFEDRTDWVRRYLEAKLLGERNRPRLQSAD